MTLVDRPRTAYLLFVLATFGVMIALALPLTHVSPVPRAPALAGPLGRPLHDIASPFDRLPVTARPSPHRANPAARARGSVAVRDNGGSLGASSRTSATAAIAVSSAPRSGSNPPASGEPARRIDARPRTKPRNGNGSPGGTAPSESPRNGAPKWWQAHNPFRAKVRDERRAGHRHRSAPRHARSGRHHQRHR